MDKTIEIEGIIADTSGEILAKTMNVTPDAEEKWSDRIRISINGTIGIPEPTEQVLFFYNSHEKVALGCIGNISGKAGREKTYVYMIILSEKDYLRLRTDPSIFFRLPIPTEKDLYEYYEYKKKHESPFTLDDLNIGQNKWDFSCDILVNGTKTKEMLANVYLSLMWAYKQKSGVMFILNEKRFDFIRNLLMTFPLDWRTISFTTSAIEIDKNVFNAYIVTERNYGKDLYTKVNQDSIVLNLERGEITSGKENLSLEKVNNKYLRDYASFLSEKVFNGDIKSIVDFNNLKENKWQGREVEGLSEAFKYFVYSRSEKTEEIINAAKIIKSEDSEEAKNRLYKLLFPIDEVELKTDENYLEQRIEALNTLKDVSENFSDDLREYIHELSKAELNSVRSLLKEFREVQNLEDIINTVVEDLKKEFYGGIAKGLQKIASEEIQKIEKERVEIPISIDKEALISKAEKYSESSDDEKKKIEKTISGFISEILKELEEEKGGLHQFYANSENFGYLEANHPKFIEFIDRVINPLHSLHSKAIAVSEKKMIKESAHEFLNKAIEVWKGLEKYDWEKVFLAHSGTVEELFNLSSKIYTTYIMEIYRKLRELSNYIETEKTKTLGVVGRLPGGRVIERTLVKHRVDKHLSNIESNFTKQESAVRIEYTKRLRE